MLVHGLRGLADGRWSTAEDQGTVVEKIMRLLQPSIRIRSWVYDSNGSLGIDSGFKKNIDIQARRLFTAMAKNGSKVSPLLSIEKNCGVLTNENISVRLSLWLTVMEGL